MITGKSVAAVLGLSAVAGLGFSRGLTSSGATSAFLGAATGDPTLDRDVLGTNVSMGDLFLPPVFSRLGVGRGLPLARSGLPKLAGLLGTGLLNRQNITAGLSNAGAPFASQSSPSNTMPYADGSIVFGMYNSRYGG